MTTRSVTITLAHHTQTWTVTQARAWATRRARAQLADQGVDMVGDPRDWVHTTSHGHPVITMTVDTRSADELVAAVQALMASRAPQPCRMCEQARRVRWMVARGALLGEACTEVGTTPHALRRHRHHTNEKRTT